MKPPHRKNMRLQGFDYASEACYFVTIVTKDREPLFGEVVDEEIVLNQLGEIVNLTWNDLVNHNPDIGLGEYVIMPNHVHGIIAIFNPVGAGSQPAQFGVSGAGSQPAPHGEPGVGLQPGVGLPVAHMTHQGANTAEPGVGLEPTPTKMVPLSEIVRQLKTFSAKRINVLRGTPGIPVWQRNYFDRVIRSDQEYENIAAYIANNPANWEMDSEQH